MFTKKLFLSAVILIFLFSWASPQSLVELAKKEKERREKIADKKTTAVTNADLLKKKRNPALESLTNDTIVSVPPDSVTTEESDVVLAEENETKNTDESDEAAVAKLEESWNKSEEYASLLALNIRGLLQEFYSTGDMKVKEDIQRQMNGLSLLLEKAKQDAEKAKEEYDLAKEALEKKKLSLTKINK